MQYIAVHLFKEDGSKVASNVISPVPALVGLLQDAVKSKFSQLRDVYPNDLAVFEGSTYPPEGTTPLDPTAPLPQAQEFVILFHPPQRKRTREAWKLIVTIPKGAGHQHLRERMYKLAEECIAFGGYIRYASPVTGTSDLEAELFFESNHDARTLETKVLEAVRDRWRSENLPQTQLSQIDDIDFDSMRRIFAQHYDRSSSPPDRAQFLFEEVEERSAKTTVLDDEEIDKESVVSRFCTTFKFERCHIDPSLKHTAGDTTGNHIPLPSNWHDLFDAYTSDKIASISIVPAGQSCIGEKDKEGRAIVPVHVYFDPNSPDAPPLSSKLRDATMIRQNVFQVTVFKKEPEKFCELLQNRHDAIMQKWKRVP